MFDFFQKGKAYVVSSRAGYAGMGLFFNGLLCILFGLAIFINPELLAFLVATVLVVIGVTLLTTWWKIRHWTRKP